VDPDPAGANGAYQEGEEETVVGAMCEDALSVLTAIDNVVQAAGFVVASSSGHGDLQPHIARDASLVTAKWKKNA